MRTCEMCEFIPVMERNCEFCEAMGHSLTAEIQASNEAWPEPTSAIYKWLKALFAEYEEQGLVPEITDDLDGNWSEDLKLTSGVTLRHDHADRYDDADMFTLSLGDQILYRDIDL